VLKGIDSLILGLDDPSEGKRFYEDFGLSQAESGAGQSVFRTQDGSRIVLRASDDADLPAAVSAGSTIREIVWAVATPSDLEQIAAELSKDRPVTADADQTLHSVDNDGYGVAFRLDGRTAVTPPANRTNIYGAEPSRPVNSTIDFHEAVKPTSVAHVVIYSPDVSKAERFYIDRLGFRVSDRFQGGHGVFLRAPGSPYHHTLFILRGEKALHHVAFAVRDFTEVMNGGVSLLKSGWEPQFGPGRHIMGANYFWYFQSPCGGAMELTADMDMVDENWTPREVPFAFENTAAWSMSLNRPPRS
jgi:catechol 2,3-dioxygenase-like lactoylglutathione lyase family enzyme